MKSVIYSIAISSLFFISCHSGKAPRSFSPSKSDSAVVEAVAEETPVFVSPPEIIGSIERMSPELDKVLIENASIEIIAKGFIWSEGPVWLKSRKALLFSDVPRNSIFKWSEKEGLSLYLTPSGYTGPPVKNAEPGSNGLLLNKEGMLVLCQHGNRQIARMDAPVSEPAPLFTTLCDRFQGKRLNSPNDAVMTGKGVIYFTDPPYGLPEKENDPGKELTFQGVYRLSADGEVALVTDQMSRPNGIALSPDENTLYVSNSDPDRPVWMAFDLDQSGLPERERVFFDATELAKTEKGLPDGMKVNRSGFIFASGPGGVLIFSPEGNLIGRLITEVTASNCALNSDESVLYITADMDLLRVRLK